MKKILCPTDFSETAQSAIAYAAKLAQVMQADLTLLNVQSVFDLTPVEVFRGRQTTLADATERLDAESRQISKAFRISCYSEVQSSSSRLSTVIQEKAKGYDLIVMGSDGPDDLYQFFSGSNTYNSILRSETPFVVVPSGYVYSEIGTIVYAFDYLHEKNLPLTRLVPIVKAFKCQLTILQVMEEGYNKQAEDDLKELQFIIKNIYGDDLHFQYDTIRSSEIAQSINSYILRSQPDALALCSVHRNLLQRLFHKSVIKHLTAFSSYPVFVIPQ